MNEGIDIAFMGAKLATSNNKPASIAAHGISAFYNIAQIARYGYLCAEQQALFCNGYNVYYDADLIRRHRQEQIKHTALALGDIIMLFAIGLSDNNSR